MTHTADNLKCLVQERAYSKGWEERMDGHPYPPEPVSRFYAMGWKDADKRERLLCMMLDYTPAAELAF